MSSNVAITDFFKRINVFRFEESSLAIVEGLSVTFTVFAQNLATGTLLHYYTTGNAGISGSNTGSVAMNGVSNTITITSSSTIPANEIRNFNLILSESNLGTPIATSNTITVVDSSAAYLNATGGNVTTIAGYKIHTFNSSNTFAITNLSTATLKSLEYLIIAGGGGGGGTRGAGGGAGGYRTGNVVAAGDGNITVIVGAGGSGATAAGFVTSATAAGSTGNHSNISIGSISSAGGGGGAIGWSGSPHNVGKSGGSGGGGGDGGVGGAGNTPSTSPSQGNNGAAGPANGGGGGGGAGGAGSGTSGGAGSSSSITGTATTRAGGGGGAPAGPGGSGGGGTAGGIAGGAGATNTGSGGGGGGPGGGPTELGGNGGSGIVIIRYAYVPPAFYTSVTANASAVIEGSNAFFVINTTFANASILHYDTVGNVTTSNFVNGNTGSFTVTSNATVLRLETVANIPNNETRNFALRIREDSLTGNIVLVSSNILLIDTAKAYINATGGGNVFTSNGFRSHVFTNSGNLTFNSVSELSERNILNYLVVAGGGAGGYLTGGGAGGLIQGQFSLTSANLGVYTIQIGGGGSAGAPGTFLAGGPGTPSYIQNSGNTIHLSTMAGGGGGWTLLTQPGGSGGGGSPTTATGIPGQGNSGASGLGGGGGGSGGNGQPGPFGGAGGIGSIVSIANVIPSVYGQNISGNIYFAGGGGGQGAGGLGGGGTGAPASFAVRAGNIFTGGGGGGGSSDQGGPTNYGGAGGSGIIIIRYPFA